MPLDQVYGPSMTSIPLLHAPESNHCLRQVTTVTPVPFDSPLVATWNAQTQPLPQAEGAITFDNTSVFPYDDVASLFSGHMVNWNDETIMTVMCSTPWPLPPSSPSASKSYTSCTFAYQLLKAINERRFMPMSMDDVIMEWLWYGFRGSDDSAGRCCVVDDGVLYSVAVNLLQ